jgi:FtsH-binding integral membrane protein
VPGDRPPADRAPRRLDRRPGERYVDGAATGARREPSSAAPGRVAGILGIVATTLGGSVLVGLLGSIDLGPGLVVLALFIGWAVALSVIWAMPVRDAKRRWLRPALSAVLAAGSVAGGLLLLWAWALAEGGVLGPVAYADARFGLVAPILLVAAAIVATVRAR